MMRLKITVAVVVVCGAAAAIAAASPPIAGASYKGFGTDGAAVTLDVSSDATTLVFHLVGVKGGNCELGGAGKASISGGAFHFHTTNQMDLNGSFTGPQSAGGTFHIYSSMKGCDSGTVHWTATTNAKPPVATFTTRVAFHKLSKSRVGGRVSSSSAACVSGRTVVLWMGSERVGKTSTKAGGKYSFARSARLRGHTIHASVAARTVRDVLCKAGISPALKG